MRQYQTAGRHSQRAFKHPSANARLPAGCLQLHQHPLKVYCARAAPESVASSSGSSQVPEVGWLWTAGKKATQNTSPSAAATVANLRQDRIKAKKSLGQNFVTDDSVLRDIVAASGVQPGDQVLEIGPGTGNLTKHLLDIGAHVTAIEKDDTLYARLVAQYQHEPRLKLINADVLRVGVEAVIQKMLQHGDVGQAAEDSTAQTTQSSQPPMQSASSASPPTTLNKKVKVLTNLPYNITRDFLKVILPLGELVSECHIMLQDEVGVRYVNRQPGRADYRAMNVRVLYYSKPKYRFSISKTKYYPVPGVDGALVTFKLLPPDARLQVPTTEKAFLNLVNKCFSQKRKMIRNSLQPYYTPQMGSDALSQVGLNPEARAQDLTLEEFVQFHWKLHELTIAELGAPPAGSDGLEEGEQEDE